MFCHCMNSVHIWGYPNELKIKDTTDTQKSASYPDLHLEIDNGRRLKIKCYDFTFPIVNFPFIVSIFKQHQDKEFIFCILELVPNAVIFGTKATQTRQCCSCVEVFATKIARSS